MYNDKRNFTRLTLEQSDLKVTWEVPYEDVTGDDMMQAIKTIMIGMTFCEETVENSMANYIDEHSDKYEVCNKIRINELEECPCDYEDPKDEQPIKPHYYA